MNNKRKRKKKRTFSLDKPVSTEGSRSRFDPGLQ
jgi:hypothetical protein